MLLEMGALEPCPRCNTPSPFPLNTQREAGEWGRLGFVSVQQDVMHPTELCVFWYFPFFFFLRETVVFRNENKRSVAREGEERESPPLALHTHARGALSSQRSSGDAFGDSRRPHAAVPWVPANIVGVTKMLLSLVPPLLIPRRTGEQEAWWSRPSRWHRSSQEAEMASVASSLLGW